MSETVFYLKSSAGLGEVGAELERLEELLSADHQGRIAAVLLALSPAQDDSAIREAAAAWLTLCAEHERACMIQDRVELAAELGFDGVHLSRAIPKDVSTARDQLGDEIQIGASCGRSLDRAMQVGEAGADYVAFGPFGGAGDKMGKFARLEMLADWVVTTELPVVAEGVTTETELEQVSAQHADFVLLEPAHWDLASV